LVLLGGEFAEVSCPDRLVHLAVSVELVHMATLLHDDVIDDAPTRRGQPTINSLLGLRLAVLVGDYLFARAFELLGKWGTQEMLQGLAGVVRAMAEVEAQALTGGFEPNLTEQEYWDRVAKKTALLMAECPRVGALAGDAPVRCQEALHRYGFQLGLAYQAVDDLLDLTAEPAALGKPTGQDLRRGVVTLPLIHAMAHCSIEDRGRLQALIRARFAPDDGAEWVLRLLESRGSIAYALAAADRMVDRACAALAVLPAIPARDRLESIARSVPRRDC
jgi:geranylgeranyl pyrophosphate synthase